MTDEERRALAYIMVEGSDAWYSRVVQYFGPEKAAWVIAHKIQKALLLVDGVSDEDYITRAERDALAEAEMQPTPEQIALSRELTLASLEADVAAAKDASLYLALAYLEQQITELTEVAKLEEL